MADKAIAWDGKIENDGKERQPGMIKALQPKGTYRFGVMSLEKGESKNVRDENGKPCPMATLTLGIYADDDVKYERQLTTVEEHLVLAVSCEWKLCQFFRCIGDKKHGEAIVMNWENVPGSVGRCDLMVDEFTKRDKVTVAYNNKVERFLDPTSPAVTPEASKEPALPPTMPAQAPATAAPAPEQAKTNIPF